MVEKSTTTLIEWLVGHAGARLIMKDGFAVAKARVKNEGRRCKERKAR